MDNVKVPVEQLVIAISHYTELYDMSHKRYSNVHIKESIWEQIGRSLGLSGKACSNKWKYLRDKYKKKREEQEKARSGAEGGVKKRKWKYIDILSLLESYNQDRETSSNYDQPATAILNSICSKQGEDKTEDSLDSEASLVTPLPTDHPLPSFTSTPSPHLDPSITTSSGRWKRKASPPEPSRKLTMYQAQILNKLDQGVGQTKYSENEHYLLSLAATLDRLDPRKQAMVRLCFQQALFEIEFGESTLICSQMD